MNGIIIYQGKYGATHRYASWLSAALCLPIADPTELSPGKMAGYDLVILGSAVYIGKLLIGKWLKENMQVLSDKKLFLFVVCATAANENEKLQTIKQENLLPMFIQLAHIYFLPGKMIKSQLSIPDLLMLKVGAFFTKDKTDSRKMLADFNDLNKDNLAPMIIEINRVRGQGQKNLVNERTAEFLL